MYDFQLAACADEDCAESLLYAVKKKFQLTDQQVDIHVGANYQVQIHLKQPELTDKMADILCYCDGFLDGWEAA